MIKLKVIAKIIIRLCYAGCMAAILLTPYDLNRLKQNSITEEEFFAFVAPSDVNMSEEKLDGLSEYVIQNHPGISGIIAIKDNLCFYEKYFGNSTEKDLFELNSVTKSVIGSLVGCAIDRNIIENENVSFAELAQITNCNSDFATIKISDMLTMSSGIDWDLVKQSVSLRFDIIKNGNKNYFELMKEFPIANKPGIEFRYDSYESRSIMAALSKNVGKEDYEVLSEYLFDDLGIYNFVWPINKTKIMPGGQDLFLTLRQLTKYGNLYANKGRYYDKQLISEEWVERSLTAHIVAESEDCYPADMIGYGYYWWCLDYKDIKIRFAFGAGGQYIFVVPEEHLTVAISSVDKLKGENYRDIMLDFFIPAIM